MKVNLSIDRFEGEQAVLLGNGFKVVWPKDKLPKDCHEGSSIVIQIITDKEEQKKQQELAKDILNELLGSNH